MLSNSYWNGNALAWLIALLLVGLFLTKLRPKLPVELNWFSAFFIVIILALLVMHGLTLHPSYSSHAIVFTWNLDQENNIPTNVSTVLLFTVSIVASRVTLSSLSYRKRLFWFIFALTYFIFALDEYLVIHETFYDLFKIVYPILVALLVVVLLILQHSASKVERESLHWLLGGLFLSVFGAYLLDAEAGISVKFPVLLLEFGIDLLSAEEMLELFGTFFVLLGLIRYSRSRIRGWANARYFRLYLVLLPILAFISLRYLFWLTPFYELKVYAEPVNVAVDEVAIALQGISITQTVSTQSRKK